MRHLDTNIVIAYLIGNQYNYYSQYSQRITALPQFVEELRKLALEVSNLKGQTNVTPGDARMIEAVETSLQEAAQEK
jgi:hypothetical protein